MFNWLRANNKSKLAGVEPPSPWSTTIPITNGGTGVNDGEPSTPETIVKLTVPRTRDIGDTYFGNGETFKVIDIEERTYIRYLVEDKITRERCWVNILSKDQHEACQIIEQEETITSRYLIEDSSRARRWSAWQDIPPTTELLSDYVHVRMI